MTFSSAHHGILAAQQKAAADTAKQLAKEQQSAAAVEASRDKLQRFIILAIFLDLKLAFWVMLGLPV
ncbi:hypothetical protein L9G74_20540, partial [Shewanella sp. C32]